MFISGESSSFCSLYDDTFMDVSHESQNYMVDPITANKFNYESIKLLGYGNKGEPLKEFKQ